jgi:hypothetical protein
MLLLDETGVRDMTGRRVDSVENFSANRPRYPQEQRLQDGVYGSDPARPIRVTTEAGVQVVRGPQEVAPAKSSEQDDAYKSFQVVQDPASGQTFLSRMRDDGTLKVSSLAEERNPQAAAALKAAAEEAVVTFSDQPEKLRQRIKDLRDQSLASGTPSELVDYILPATLIQ